MIFTTHKIPYFRLSALLLLMLSLTYCRDDDDQQISGCPDITNPDCENYDPCHDVETPTADFLMQAPILGREDTFIGSNSWLLAPDDSIFWDEVRFTAVHKGHHHQFFIGREVLEKESVERRHSVEKPYATYASHVITYEAHEKGCYETGADTLTRNYYFPEHLNDFGIFGKYRVALKGSTDSFDMSFYIFNVFPDRIDSARLIVQNFHNLGDSIKVKHMFFASNKWGFFYFGQQRFPKGHIEVIDQKVRLRYTINDRDGLDGTKRIEVEAGGRVLKNRLN